MVIADLKPIIQKQKRRENFCPDKKKSYRNDNFMDFMEQFLKQLVHENKTKGLEIVDRNEITTIISIHLGNKI